LDISDVHMASEACFCRMLDHFQFGVTFLLGAQVFP
jgi:hypothetical protein